MKKQQLFTIQSEDKEFPVKLYLDEHSARIGLRENFNDFWIGSGQARIVTIEAVSYKEEV